MQILELNVYANNEDPGQTMHLHSLARTFAVRTNIPYAQRRVHPQNEGSGPKEWLCMRI